MCIDCGEPPPISDDNVPLLVALDCLHFICHPCWDVLVATIDAEARAGPSPGAEPEHPSLAASFCHVCHPSFSPAPSSPISHRRPRTPPTDSRNPAFCCPPCSSSPPGSPPPSLPPSAPASPTLAAASEPAVPALAVAALAAAAAPDAALAAAPAASSAPAAAVTAAALAATAEPTAAVTAAAVAAAALAPAALATEPAAAVTATAVTATTAAAAALTAASMPAASEPAAALAAAALAAASEPAAPLTAAALAAAAILSPAAALTPAAATAAVATAAATTPLRVTRLRPSRVCCGAPAPRTQPFLPIGALVAAPHSASATGREPSPLQSRHGVRTSHLAPLAPLPLDDGRRLAASETRRTPFAGLGTQGSGMPPPSWARRSA